MSDGKVGQAAFQAFLNIAKKWEVNPDQQRTLLGRISISVYRVWKSHVEKSHEINLPNDILERISYLVEIYKALNILLPTHEAANRWINQPNAATLFNHHSALTKMLSGNIADLADVRRYLNAQRL